jgi:hypothetical protein
MGRRREVRGGGWAGGDGGGRPALEPAGGWVRVVGAVPAAGGRRYRLHLRVGRQGGWWWGGGARALRQVKRQVALGVGGWGCPGAALRRGGGGLGGGEGAELVAVCGCGACGGCWGGGGEYGLQGARPPVFQRTEQNPRIRYFWTPPLACNV